MIEVGQVTRQVTEESVDRNVTRELLNAYSLKATERLNPLKTPRTPAVQDNILMVCAALFHYCSSFLNSHCFWLLSNILFRT
jgi:hypothetical protein